MVAPRGVSNPTQHPVAPPRSVAAARLVIAVCLAASVAYFLVRTRSWPLVNDGAQIDYMCFLMDHGRAPYRDNTDMNMPGIYLTNWAVMHTLGGGAAAWRVFDDSLMAAMAVAMLVIAWPYDWLGGLIGAALFALIHGRAGPSQTGERDFIIAVLLVWACACLFLAFRRTDSRWLSGFGFCLAAAITIKPLPVVFALLIPFVLLRARRQGIAAGKALLYIGGGMLIPAAAVLVFLLHERALASFLHIVFHVLPFYSHIGRLSIGQLTMKLNTIPSLSRLVLFLMASVFVCRRWWNWECRVLIAGMAFGVFSWFAQGKAFRYHRYPAYAFLLLWGGIQLTMAVRGTKWSRRIGWAALAFLTGLAPIYASEAAKAYWPMNYMDALKADLHTLGGSRLSGHVQCLATPGDCDATLYAMRLLQPTSLSYDYFIFVKPSDPVVVKARERFWREIHRSPPDVFVVTIGLYPPEAPGVATYRKLNEWPEFADYLREQYCLYADREFRPMPNGPSGYRIYVRRGYLQPLARSSGRMENEGGSDVQEVAPQC